MIPRRATIILALAAAGVTLAPQAAGAQSFGPNTDLVMTAGPNTDQAAVDQCRPQLEQMTQLDPRGATFTIPDGCPAGVQVRYSANLVNQPCGLTLGGERVCTLPDDWTVPWHQGLLDQTLVASGVRDATPGPTLMPLVDACEAAPGALLQLDLDVIPPGGDTVNVTHRYHQCQPATLTADQPRDLPPVLDEAPPSPPAGDVTPESPPSSDEVTQAGGAEGATPVTVDAPGPDRAALPDTGADDTTALVAVGAGLLAAGSGFVAKARRIARRSVR